MLAGSRLLAVERALQKQARQEMRALQEQARQDMRAGEQVIAYPGEASTAQPCLQDLSDNWDAEKIVSSVAEAALGRQVSGRWAWRHGWRPRAHQTTGSPLGCDGRGA